MDENHDKQINWIKSLPSGPPTNLSLVINIDTREYGLVGYVGMGENRITRLTQCEEVMQRAVQYLADRGQLVEQGEPFTEYPGSDYYRKVIYRGVSD